jgi:hypothetical protein
MPDCSHAHLDKIFNDFQPALHLCTAAELQSDLWQGIDDGRKLADFLGFAEQLRQMGETTYTNGKSLLNPSETWKVPPAVILPSWKIPMPTPAMLAASMSKWPDLAKSI